MNVVIAGHFNPLTVGHLQLIRAAQSLGDTLTVIVANDVQALSKKGHTILPLADRMTILSHIVGVNYVIPSIDTDASVKETLRLIKPDIFASGCSETDPDAIEEAEVCRELGIKMVFGVGGKKIRNSSDIVK